MKIPPTALACDYTVSQVQVGKVEDILNPKWQVRKTIEVILRLSKLSLKAKASEIESVFPLPVGRDKARPGTAKP